MKTGEAEIAKMPAGVKTKLQFPNGLLGFESITHFELISLEEEHPFSWLRAEADPSIAFLIIPPFPFFPEYQPDIPTDDVRALGLETPQDALVYNIVTLRGQKPATVNLKGPLVINRHSLLAKQVVLANAMKYSVHHPLPTEG